jgi:hypothetical protein
LHLIRTGPISSFVLKARQSDVRLSDVPWWWAQPRP